MTLSTQHLIDKIRKPRVHITYDVQIGDAIEKKELPFVVGILADLSGMPKNPLPKFRERKFTYVDEDNLDEVFASAQPRLCYEVKDVINPGQNGDNTIQIELNLKSLADFTPLNLVKNIPQLSALFEESVMMKDLLAKAEGSELLADILKLLIEDDDTRNGLKQVVSSMKAQLAPKVDSAAQAQAAKDANIDSEIKTEIKAAEAKRKSSKNGQKTSDNSATASSTKSDKDKS